MAKKVYLVENLDCANCAAKVEAALGALPEVQEAVAKAAQALGDTGRILVRESGTEPVVRVMVEAETEDICHQHVDSVVEMIKAKGYSVS